MNERIKKIGRGVMQGTLSVLALGIVLLALLQIVLMIGFASFNTGKGRDFVEAKLQSLLSESGYNISIGSLFYDPVRGLNVYNVEVRDAQGIVATLDRLSLGIVLEKLPMKDLELFASGGTLAIARFPATSEKETIEKDGDSIKIFALPDLYFKRLAIDYFTMEAITLPSADPAVIRSLSPTLRAEILLEEKADISLSMVTRPSPAFKVMQAPEEILIKGSFDPSTLSYTLGSFKMAAAHYRIQGSGEGVLGTDGFINFQIAGEHNGLEVLTAHNLQSANFDIAATGSAQDPTVSVNGTIVTAKLGERGLGNITIKARGTDLLQKPRIEADIQTHYGEENIALNSVILYATPSIIVEKLEAAAPFAMVTGTGSYDLETAFADFKLDIAVDKLAHYSALAGIDLSGVLKSNISAKPLKDKQALNLKATIDKGKYGATTVRKVDADLSFPDILAIHWPQEADVKIASLAISKDLYIESATIALKQNEERAYRLSLNGNGSMGRPFTIKGSSLIESFSTPMPTVKDIDLVLGLRQSSIALKGAIDPQIIDLTVATNNLRTGDLPVDVSGKMRRISIDGNIHMTGTPSAPVTVADIGITGLNTGKYEGLSIDLYAKHENGRAQTELSGKGTGIRSLNAEASVPLTFTLAPFAFNFDTNAEMNGKLLADIDLAPISSLFLQSTQIVTGTLNADGTIGGTALSPSVNGNASIDKASFVDEQNGIELDGIIVKSRFSQDSVNITTLQATDGENGTLNGSGNISFGESGTDLALAMTNFHLPKSNAANGFLNAKLALRDSGKAYEATGTIDIQSMDILIPETFQSQIPELNIVKRGEEEKQGAGKSLLFDIDVAADNQFFVRGWGLDAEFGGAIDINGSTDEPLFEGSFKARRGRYEEFGKRFELARADLRFQGTIPPSPYLDIEAITNAEDVVASVLLTGPVQKPEISFSSVPSLPEDEVLARILFGKSATKISAFQAIQLTQTIQRFSGQGGGLDPLGMLRGMTGLDDISVETDSEGQTNVGVGKYLTDNVYLEFERGAGETSGGANLQIEVSPSVTIESEIGQDAQGGGGIFWKKDY